MDHAHQPPGGYSSINGIPGPGQGSPEADKQSKRAVQQAYQEELRKQVQKILFFIILTLVIYIMVIVVKWAIRRLERINTVNWIT